MVGTQTEQTHTQLTKTRAADRRMGPRWRPLAPGGLRRQPGRLGQWAPSDFSQRNKWGKNTAPVEVLNSRNSASAAPGQLVRWPFCTGGAVPLPAGDGEGAHSPEPLLRVAAPTVAICLPFVPPLPLLIVGRVDRAASQKQSTRGNRVIQKRACHQRETGIHGNHLSTAA